MSMVEAMSSSLQKIQTYNYKIKLLLDQPEGSILILFLLYF